MILHTEGFKIEFFSTYVNDLITKNNLTIHGSQISEDGIMVEFGAVFEDEDIVFDVYYDKAYQFSKLHIDEDYQRTFHDQIKVEEFQNSRIIYMSLSSALLLNVVGTQFVPFFDFMNLL